MKSLLVNGIYDLKTLQTLQGLGVNHFGFDLRARSPNLVPFSTLSNVLISLPTSEFFLHFQDDKIETVLSFLSLLKDRQAQSTLVFRDSREPSYYEKINHDFYWMFSPDADWRSIVELPKSRGIFLPLRWQDYYQSIPNLWKMIENKKLEIFIHANNFAEIGKVLTLDDVQLSVDLSSEMEKSYRLVDQDRLKNMPIWRGKNESFTI